MINSKKDYKSFESNFNKATAPSKSGGMTEAMDDAMDKKAGIKENSKRDMAQDKKNGVMQDMDMPMIVIKKGKK